MIFKKNCNYSEGNIPRGVLACFLPKSRDIQGKMPSPKVIWNAFWLVTVRVQNSYEKLLSGGYYFTGGTLMYLNGLDELDQKIIQLLIENARISYSDIGKETGISRVAVKARIQALEKKGIIEEYTTIINPQKISGAVS